MKKSLSLSAIFIFLGCLQAISQEVTFETTNGYYGGQLFELAAGGNSLYALSLDGVIRSEDGGEEWSIVLDLPVDEGFYSNTVYNELVANDSVVVVSYLEEEDGEINRIVRRSTDNGESWETLPVPDGVSSRLVGINNNFLFTYSHYLDLNDPTYTFYPKTEPLYTGVRRHYQNDYAVVYNQDSLCFSADNIQWTCKLMPVTAPASGGTSVALVDNELYVSFRSNLFKTLLTDDSDYITLLDDYLNGRIASKGESLYIKRRGSDLLLEVNMETLSTNWIQGSTFDFLDEMVFTNEFGFVKTYVLGPVHYDIHYHPILRFERFTHVFADDIALIRSSLNRENTYKLVNVNDNLFACSVGGLFRYSEDENLWTFIETPFYQVKNISWNAGHYYLVDGSETYRTADFENWEQLFIIDSDIYTMLPYGETMLFLGSITMSAHNEEEGAWTVNEIADFGNGGTYPYQFALVPASICNDTIVAYSNGDMYYSPDGGESWEMFFDDFQSHLGFVEGENVYYFKYHFDIIDNIVQIYFAKKSKHTRVLLSDYESVYEGPFIYSEANLIDFRFMKSDEFLFYTHPGVGVVYSNDDGENWNLLTNELAFMFVTSMAATEDYFYFASKRHGIRRMGKDLITEIAKISQPSDLRVFPNPATTVLWFSENSSGRIYDITGKYISDFKNKNFIDIADLAIGLYLVRFDNAQLPTRVFVKN